MVSTSSARRIVLSGAPPIWMLGAQGAICLLRATPPPYPAGVAYTSTCVSTEQAIAGLLVNAYTEIDRHPQVILIVGVVPDDATKVELISAGGRRVRLQVRENAYATVARAPRSVSFDTGATNHTVPIPLAPGSPGAVLGVDP
jgi:hypothetical protein